MSVKYFALLNNAMEIIYLNVKTYVMVPSWMMGADWLINV